MPRVVVILLALLIVAGGVLPGETDARRDRKRIIVIYDYTSDALTDVVSQMVAEFAAVMPRSGPKLIYRRGEGPCFDGHQQRNVYVVCSARSVPGGRDGFYSHYTHRVDLLEGMPAHHEAPVVCHELMHALTGIPDNYDALPDQSCVWGSLSTPGPFDIEQLALAYARPGRKRR